MGFLVTCTNKGRLGNCIFRYLASRLFMIFYDYINIRNIKKKYYLQLDDIMFKNFYIYILKNGTPPFMDTIEYDNIIFNGYYQHDTIYKVYKNVLIDYIKKNPIDIIETDRGEIYYAKDILGEKPKIDILYKTIIHLRIEDYIDLGLAMDPLCIVPVLEKCEQPFLFVHKPIVNVYDQKYIDFFKERYPSSQYYCEDVVQCYNLMRHAETLVCSKSTLSWIAALFNEKNPKVYMPRNYGTLDHETFQYPNDNTEIYEWKIISKEDIMKL